ncbi:DUF935 domain-containing protein [Cupriavidus sp. BIC8F]|uniref:DUF935 domain-containing protein n=1 Tax=Cupriavidus sp. BIC8F TaxID=3079014 RepID=UPI0029168E0D|nr:DUF935 domain-containing protein [Cupriavidus sp. BIC8F]
MAKIVDQFGRPFERTVLSESQSARLQALHHDYAGHPSRGLTPARLARILELAELGDLLAQADLFQDMEEKDGHIFAEMSKRKRALLTLDWNIVPPVNASAEEKRQAELIDSWFRDLQDFDDVLLDLLDGIGHGFSALEISWDRIDGVWLPVKFTHRPQRWFMTPFGMPDDLRLRGYAAQGEELWPFGWAVHRHKAKSGYIGRAGLHRVLSWPYLFKNFAVRDLAEFLEIYGLPLRVGTYGAGASKDEKLALLRAVSEIGHNAAGIIPEGMKIDFQNAAQGTQVPYETMIGTMDRIQSKVILGGTLTSQADGKSSTNALGNVHNEVRHDLMVSDARQLAGTIKRDIIFAICALNFELGDRRRMPDFVFDTRAPEDMKLYADALPKLVGIGVKVPRAWAHEKLAIPEPKEGEDVLTVARPEMAVPPELRPKETAPRTAAMSYRAVLTNDQGEIVYPDQHALDTAAGNLPAEALSAKMAKLLAPAIQAIQAGEEPDRAIEALVAAYPNLDESAVAELLARAIFVADVWGRLNGNA